jgi:hypothetical protein
MSMFTLEYILDKDKTKIQKQFHAVAEIKTKTLLTACGIDVDLDNDSFLVIGPNLAPIGLSKLGAKNITVINGIETLSVCDNISWFDGDLIDFAVQGTKFDWVLAPDEFLVRFATEEKQRQVISTISKIATKGFITTLKDYKNMHNNKKHFEEPFILKSDNGDAIIIRNRQWSKDDRQQWTQRSYVIDGDTLESCDTFMCRTMYFKQLAKFTSDEGAKNFAIEKDTLYKPLFSKEFEYIVVINF